MDWPTPDEQWDYSRTGRDTAETLTRIAGQLTLASRFIRRASLDESEGCGTLHGIAFRNEGWWADVPVPPSGVPGLILPRPSLSPDRVEIRLINCVDRAGITYSAMLKRGQDRAERIVTYPGSQEKAAAGAVMDALDLMVEAMCGIPVMDTTRRPY